MRWLEKLIFQLFPSIKIRPRWRALWEQRERRAFRTNSYYFFSFFGLAYVAHYFFIDKPLHKQPLELWAKYRFGMAAVALLGLLFTYFWYQRTRYFKIPLAFAGWIFSYTQAQSMIWRGEIPYSYSIILPCIGILALRTSVPNSLLFLLICFTSEYPAWSSRPNEMPYILSAAIVSSILVTIFRSRMTTDVDAFISEQERIEAKEETIAAQRETSEQIRAFLPKEIYRRVDFLIRTEKKTIVQAMDEVLRPREDAVTVLYSDIRGFTRLTKIVDEFIAGSAMPNMKTCTAIIENHHGICRPIGDLVFAYFDSFFETDNPAKSFHRAIQAAVAITQNNASLNETLELRQRVRRYVLLSFGMGVVGNIGGTESAREITVFGNPANILSRIDPITKTEPIQKNLDRPVLIFTEDATKLANHLFASLEWMEISLSEYNIIVRDFPEETHLHLLPLTERNLRILKQAPANGYPSDYSQFIKEAQITRVAA